jgi:hypothetical protein
MLFRKIDPVLADVPIDKYQAHIFNALPDFNVLWDCHHRAYLNPKQKFQYIPEVYFNRHYKEVLITNEMPLTSFFILSDRFEYDARKEKFTGNISMFVQCSDLDKLIDPTFIQRADLEFINQFMIANSKYKQSDMLLTNVVTGLENVYEGMDTTNLDYQDMNQWFVFRMDFKAEWYVTKKCN